MAIFDRALRQGVTLMLVATAGSALNGGGVPVGRLLHGMRAASSPQPQAYYAATQPRQYVAYKVSGLSPEELDGDLSKTAWAEVGWSEDFVDIATSTLPQFRTRVKMRWDEDFLFVAAELTEPDVWATLTEHDSVIFHDNDFEIFVDANATTHYYKEFEMNALNTTWDLCLNKPYGDSGYENSSRVFGDQGWDMQPPLRCAVAIEGGSINAPATPNKKWTVEVALPLADLMYNSTEQKPRHGSFWRINFSRVEWNVKVNETTGQYYKDPSCQSCAEPGTAAEDNWVWSPQGEVAMHLPERWGILQFSDEAVNSTEVAAYDEWSVRCAAMELYYAEHAFAAANNGSFTTDVEYLASYSTLPFEVCTTCTTEITLTQTPEGANSFIASVASPDGLPLTGLIRADRFLTVAYDSAKES